MRRTLHWLGLGVLTVLLLTAGGLAWLNSGAGLNRLTRLATQAVPGLRLQGLQGPLPWHLSANHLGFADADGQWLSLEDAELSLDLAALLRGTLRFKAVQARSLVLSRLPASSSNEPTPPSSQLLPDLPRLPIGVDLARLAIERIDLAAPVLGQPAVFRLEGQAQAEGAFASGHLALQRQDAPGQVMLRFAFQPGDRLEATLAAEDVADGPLARLTGQPDQPLSLALQVAGPASGAALTLRAGQGTATNLTAEGIISSTGDATVALQLQGQASFGPLLPASVAAAASPVRFAVDLALSPQRLLTFHKLSLAAPAGTAETSGTLDLGSEAVDLALTLRLPDAATFAGMLPANLGWGAASVAAHVTGSLSQPLLAASVELEGVATGQPALDAALGPRPTLQLDLALPRQQLNLRLQGAAISLEATGVTADPLDLTARLTLPSLAALGPGFAGEAEVLAAAHGPRTDPDVTLRAMAGRLILGDQALEDFALTASLRHLLTRPEGQAHAQGHFGGHALSLNLHARPEGQGVVLEAAEAGFGAGSLSATGSLDLTSRLFTGNLRLTVPELATFSRLIGMPKLTGRLAVNATLRPEANSQGFNLQVEAPHVAFGDVSGSLRSRAEGVPENFGFSLEGRSPLGRLTAQGRAGLGGHGWHVALARVDAAGFNESLRLAMPAELRGNQDGSFELSALTLALGRGGRLEAHGSWGPQRADLSAKLSGLPLALVQTVASGLPLQGRLDGTLRASGLIGSPEVVLRLNASGVRLNQPGMNALPQAAIEAEARMTGGAYSLSAEATAGSVARLHGQVRLPAGQAGPMHGNLDGQLDLGAILAPLLAAGSDRLTGRVGMALGLAGSLAAPALSGRITLANGSYRNLPLGIRLTEVAGSLVGDNDTLRVENLTGRTTGEGRVALEGLLRPLTPGLPVDLRLTARNARPVSSDLLSATLDADLRLAGPLAGGAMANGSVTVTRADIRVPERLPASVASLPNVRQRGPLPPGRRPAPQAGLASAGMPPLGLDLKLGVRRAFIRGRGVDAELAGNIEVAGLTTAPTVTGGLQLTHGSFSILARRLVFQRGAITFADGSLLPQLDFAASTTASNTTLTAAISGNPQAPQISFSSSPELPQDEVLARLIFDRPTSNLSPFEIAQLASAAAELSGTASASNVVDRVRSGLGLDRLGLTSDPANANGAAVEAGRYVAPGLYLGVRQGSGGTTGVAVQLEITERLKLEGQTATGPAGDRLGLSYEVEY